MNLLIVTQKVDKHASILGFFHRWLEEFAKRFKKVIVICLEEGSHDLPDNVEVLSMGKETNESRIQYLYRFFKFIFSKIKEYDCVFVHMCPIYAVLGGLFWKLQNKKIGLWFTHRSKSITLMLAEKLVDIIFTASTKSLKLNTRKKKIVGHGIDCEKFRPIDSIETGDVILSAASIRPAKQQLKLLKIYHQLNEEVKSKYSLWFVGGLPSSKYTDYYYKVTNFIEYNDLGNYVSMKGAIPHKQMVKIYNQVDLLVNLSKTGSIDKDVLEAHASGTNVVTTNKAFKRKFSENYVSESKLENKLNKYLNGQANLFTSNRKKVCKVHNISNLVNKIRKIYCEI